MHDMTLHIKQLIDMDIDMRQGESDEYARPTKVLLALDVVKSDSPYVHDHLKNNLVVVGTDGKLYEITVRQIG